MVKQLFVYSTAKGQHTYHTEQCIYARQIKPEHRGYFKSIGAAEHAGYHACFRCSKLGKAYTREKHKILAFCVKAKFTCYFRKGRIVIQTPVDRWILLYDPSACCVLTYHQNHSFKRESSQKREGRIRGYHNQHWTFHSIYETLLAIFDHTQAYLKKNSIPGFVKTKIYKSYETGIPSPVGRKKRDKRIRTAKEENKKHQVGHVLDLIEYLAAKREAKKE